MEEPPLVYPIHKKIKYENDREYRQSIREIFDLSEQSNITNDDELDEISKDELNYDDERMQKWIKWIIRETADSYELQELYKLAAATMISLDTETGLVILLSFDYFKDFHQCLSAYFTNRSIDLDLFLCYEKLYRRLSNSK